MDAESEVEAEAEAEAEIPDKSEMMSLVFTTISSSCVIQMTSVFSLSLLSSFCRIESAGEMIRRRAAVDSCSVGRMNEALQGGTGNPRRKDK